MNNLRLQYKLRSDFYEIIRNFFKKRDYLEVETPLAVSCPGTEVYLDYFSSHWVNYHGKRKKLWLRSSPEIHMKQILTQDLNKIFQIAKCFRNNGEFSNWHHPEFSMLEWYETNISYRDFMTQTFELLKFTYTELQDLYPDVISFEFPNAPEYFSVKEAFYKFVEIDLEDNDPQLANKAKAKNILSVNSNDDFETAFFKIMIERIEPQLTKIPVVFLYDYPPSQAALAKIESSKARRFEVYIKGNEISNAFEELEGLTENKKRFEDTNKKRKSIKKEIIEMDPFFYKSLEKGLKPCCGNALGLDRWLALLLGQPGIDKVIPFRESLFLVHDKNN